MHAHAACSCLGTALSQPRACGCQTQMKRTAYSIYCSIDVHVYSGILHWSLHLGIGGRMSRSETRARRSELETPTRQGSISVITVATVHLTQAN